MENYTVHIKTQMPIYKIRFIRLIRRPVCGREIRWRKYFQLILSTCSPIFFKKSDHIFLTGEASEPYIKPGNPD